MKKTITLLAGAALAAGAFAGPTRPTKAIIGSIVYEPVVINQIGSADPYGAADGGSVLAKMSKQFDESIVRSAQGKHLAQVVQPISGTGPETGEFVLRTVISVSSEGGSHSNFYNQFRTGKFMDVEMTLTDGSGRIVSQARSSLVWGDGDWVEAPGAPVADVAPEWRPLPFDQVMTGYVRKAVDRGVGLLLKSVRS